MSARIDQGAGDGSVTELLNEVEFENIKNGVRKENGFTKPYKNGYTKVGLVHFTPFIYLPA